MTYTINGKPIGDIGFGIMSLALLPEDQALTAIKTAIDSGSNYINAGEFYGKPDHNSLTLLRKYFAKYPEDASKIVLNVKGCLDVKELSPNGTKESTAKIIENCLSMLGPDARIDQLEPARKDAKVDFENDTLATIDGYVKAGKIGAISCSELALESFRKAAKAYKISSLEIEFSLFRIEPLTNGLLAACAELDVPVLAYSPLGRGFLGGQIKSVDDLPEGDIRRRFPQFHPENFARNLELVAEVEKLAKKKGCTPGQVAINWLLNVSKRPGMPKIIPLPGSGNPDRIKENATIIDLSAGDVTEIDNILAHFVPAGDRYPESMSKYLDT